MELAWGVGAGTKYNQHRASEQFDMKNELEDTSFKVWSYKANLIWWLKDKKKWWIQISLTSENQQINN